MSFFIIPQPVETNPYMPISLPPATFTSRQEAEHFGSFLIHLASCPIRSLNLNEALEITQILCATPEFDDDLNLLTDLLRQPFANPDTLQSGLQRLTSHLQLSNTPLIGAPGSEGWCPDSIQASLNFLLYSLHPEKRELFLFDLDAWLSLMDRRAPVASSAVEMILQNHPDRFASEEAVRHWIASILEQSMSFRDTWVDAATEKVEVFFNTFQEACDALVDAELQKLEWELRFARDG